MQWWQPKFIKMVIALFFGSIFWVSFVQARVEIGVFECDIYYKRYEECVNTKLKDKPHQKSYLELIETTSKQLKDSIKSKEDRLRAAKTCQKAFDANREAMRAFGCENW